MICSLIPTIRSVAPNERNRRCREKQHRWKADPNPTRLTQLRSEKNLIGLALASELLSLPRQEAYIHRRCDLRRMHRTRLPLPPRIPSMPSPPLITSDPSSPGRPTGCQVAADHCRSSPHRQSSRPLPSGNPNLLKSDRRGSLGKKYNSGGSHLR